MSNERIVLLGPPGSGKGTQAKYISSKLLIPHISTGDMFRESINENTPLGNLVKDIISSGKLVSDDITSDVLLNRLKKNDTKNGFILDGYPRTLVQAERLEEIEKNLRINLTHVLYFHIKKEILIKRLLGRRVCPECAKIYNIYTDNLTKEECPVCLQKLEIRSDDNLITIETRFENYIKMTEPIINFYENKKILTKIDAAMSIEAIHNQINQIFKLN